MFEQRYTQANDRIHPRSDLLKEMQETWAAEEAAAAQAEGKVVRFPTWARFAAAAAGILLCVGVGMGSVMLLSQRRAGSNAEAQAPQMAYYEAAVSEEEAKILTGAAGEADQPETAEPETMLTAAEPELPQGMHAPLSEAEVEDAVLHGSRDGGAVPQTEAVADSEAEPEEGAVEVPQAKAAATAGEGAALSPGKVIRRGELLAVFMPATEQVHVIRRAENKLEGALSLTLREGDARVKEIFWLESQLLAVRERGGETELLRFDAADFSAPRHLQDLTQSGAFLAALERDGKLFVLSSYRATSEEPFPWVNGERMDIARLLLDGMRPGNVFTVVTVYDPAAGEGFAQQAAILIPAAGALATDGGLALWTAGESPRLYLLGEALSLTAERALPGPVIDAQAGGGLDLLLRTEEGLELLLGLDESLAERESATAAPAGEVIDATLGEGGAAFLTADGIHVLTAAGERSLALSGERVSWLAADRLLAVSAQGQLYVLGTDGELRELWTLGVREGVELLLESPDRAAFDPATGRLVFPAGTMVYQYRLEEGQAAPRGAGLSFQDHSPLEQRALRCLLLEDGAVVFYKAGAMLVNQRFERLNTHRY